MSILTQEFVFAALDAEKAGNKFPINLNEEQVWKALGYQQFTTALRRLESYKWFKYDVDYVTVSAQISRYSDTYLLTLDAYKTLASVADTEEGHETRRYLIAAEKAYREQLERQFKYAIDPEIEKLRAELDFVKTELAVFKSQLSDDFDFDLDTTHHLSGISAGRRYVIGIVLENFRVGIDFIVDDIARPNKAGLPQHKYYLKESVHNSLLVALRSVKGVPINQLPPYIVIETAEYFKLSDKKNRRFPNQKGGK